MADCQTWSDELALGIGFVDADHKALVDLLAHMETCAAANEDGVTLGSVLAALGDVVDIHFQREESLQDRAGYDGLEAHRREHRDFLQRLNGVRERFQANSGSVSLGDVARILKNWFAEHWERFDGPMAEACRSSLQGAVAAGDLRLGGEAAARLEGARVLVVDDNENFCRLSEIVLMAAGAQAVYSAASANDGLIRLSRYSVDLILVDWKMDGGDGIEFVRGLRRDGVSAPMVLVTGFAEADTESRARAAGVNGFATKPLGAADLIRAAAAALPA